MISVPFFRSFVLCLLCLLSLSHSLILCVLTLFHLAHPYGIISLLDVHVMWEYLKNQHAQNPAHLLIMGGDQVYADSVMSASEEIRLWDRGFHGKPLAHLLIFVSLLFSGKSKWTAGGMTKKGVDELDSFYFKLYLTTWTQGKIPFMFASIPTMMMYVQFACSGCVRRESERETERWQK